MIHSTKAGTVERYFKFGREGRGGGANARKQGPLRHFHNRRGARAGAGGNVSPPVGEKLTIRRGNSRIFNE